MRDEHASFTAAFVAYARALGHTLPLDARLVDDPWGAKFATPIISAWPVRLWARVARTMVVYMQVRSRTFDDVVRRFVEDEGGTQVVILGAGFDCRAVRLPAVAARADVKVFEVDHPATQATKKRVLADAGAASRATYVEWDFEKRHVRELPAALAALGHDPAKPTCTLWEGVTMYLTEEAIDATVRAVHAWAAPRSPLVFNYLDVENLRRPAGVARLSDLVVKLVGEPFRWGWPPAQLGTWLDERGWDLEWNKGLTELAQEQLPNERARGWMKQHGRYTALARRR